MGSRGIPPEVVHLPYLNPRAILHPRPPTQYLGAHHNAGSKESHEPHKPTQAQSQPSSILPPGHRHAPPPILLSTRRPAPQHPQQALPKDPASLPSQRSITAPPHARKVPGQTTACPHGGLPGERPTHRAQRFRPVRRPKEHGVMLLHRATAPFLDSTVVTIGKFRSMNGGHGSPLPSPRVVEHFRWSRLPQSENVSRLVHILSEVWGCDSTVVTIGKFRSTNGGHGSSLSSLGVVEHFRWSRLPQSESFSRLVHILSEVWGCRRFDAGVDRPRGRTPRIGTGVADYLRKPSGTFHPLSRFAMSSRGPARDLKRPSQDMAFTADHPHPTSGSVRGAASRSLEKWAGMRLMPSPPTSTKLEGSTCPASLEGERGIKGEEGSLLGPELQPSTASFQPQVRNLSFPSPQYQTRGSSWRRRANCSLCFYLPLSLKGLYRPGRRVTVVRRDR